MTQYKFKANKAKRTYTIRRYDYGKLTAKYRSNPQPIDTFSENLTENDIKAFLKYSNDYYRIK